MNTDSENDEVPDPFQTDEDSDYVPYTQEPEEEIDNGHITPAKARQPKRRTNEWKDSTAKRLRTEGKQYVGRKNKQRKGKELKKFNHLCRYHCNDISETDRRKLFTKFYELPSYDLQTSFLSSCIKQIEPARHKATASSSKKYSTVITLLGKRVCKNFFLHIFDISVRRFQVVCKKTTDGMTESDKRGKKEPPNKIKESSRNFVIGHIHMFPKYSSHYSRKDNLNAKYLSGELNIKKMYEMYKELCIAKQEVPVKESYYRFVFNTEFNLRFHKPYSDTCSRCDNFQNLIKHSKDENTVSIANRDLKLHQKKAMKATDAKKNDIIENKNAENVTVICFDLQQALPTPLLTTSKVFYLRQLWTYNFCVHDLHSGKSHMFVWDESVASRGSQEIGSCLIKFVQSLPSTVSKIIAYSDSCGGQNKNKNISKLFSFIVQATNIAEVHHKFLEPGHTYMECDRSFGLIEKKKRQIPQVFVPSDWQNIIRSTSKNFIVYNMTRKDFYSFSPLHQIMKDPKKDTNGYCFKWREISWFLYQKNERLSFKFKNTLNNDIEYRMCTMEICKVGRPSFRWSILKPLHLRPIKIKYAKYINLLTLLDYIPPLNHLFYKNLSHEGKTLKVINQQAKKVVLKKNKSQPEKADAKQNQTDVDKIENTADADSDHNDEDDVILDSDSS